MEYTNPVIRGFHPDPSVCRVGENYYLVTSSFEYFPGIPVYHSRDLVNWKQIGNCIDRPDQLPMDCVRASGGVWAPTIRYWEGRFYVTATFSERGNFIISAGDPAGPWSDPVWTQMDGIDPSMYFEEGEMYYCSNDCGSRHELYASEGISLARMDPATGRVKGRIRRIWEGSGGGFLEAPHLYHIKGWYYLIAAEGGTGPNHMATLARSRKIWGPYEGCPDNPILTNRADTSKQVLCCGHADLVEDGDSNLWLVHLGTRPAVGSMSNLGRETFLTPAKLENGWIRVSDGRRAQIHENGPVRAWQRAAKELRADFGSPEWEKQWLFLKRPVKENYLRGNGRLRLKPTQVSLADESLSPTFVAVRQMDFECETDITFEFRTCEVGDEAGAAVYLAPRFVYRICKRREADGDYLMVKKTADDFEQTAFVRKTGEGMLQIKIRADRQKYGFYFAEDGILHCACEASTRFLTCEAAGKCFTGAVTGIYAQADRPTKAVAEYHSFVQYRK